MAAMPYGQTVDGDELDNDITLYGIGNAPVQCRNEATFPIATMMKTRHSDKVKPTVQSFKA